MLESAKKHPGRKRREDFTLSQTVLFVSCYIIRAQIQDQTPLRTDRFQILHLLKTLRKIEEKLEKTCRFRLLICENLNCLPFVLYIIKHLMILVLKKVSLSSGTQDAFYLYIHDSIFSSFWNNKTKRKPALLTCHDEVSDWVALVQSEDGDHTDLVRRTRWELRQAEGRVTRVHGHGDRLTCRDTQRRPGYRIQCEVAVPHSSTIGQKWSRVLGPIFTRSGK